MQILGRGAEAVLEREGDTVIKHRIPKAYRHPTIDAALRKSRTKREAKVLSKLPIPGPKLISTDGKERITMSYLEGDPLVAILDREPALAKEIGERVAAMHDADIIHGDLTTSNMIMHQGSTHLIDFGLSFFSTRLEDRAVDIHLFKQALDSKHYAVAEKAFALFLEGYQPQNRQAILERFAIVERRGRHKLK